MGIRHDRSARLWARAAGHESDEVVEGLLVVLVLVLEGGQLRLEVLVHDEVDHGLADAPVRSGHAPPKAGDSLKRNIKNESHCV